ncbi:LOW QUALITY PROTEIN: hypothetical protein IFM46972_04231 [Aspergillus udagawae]|uniref:Uncharacterized protein n=1 Tax=Aspergillus udagawae TaxID=91492 RepID=A0A8H3RW80_9EURO|nr:LOW QUALITY PROTEIN: hypothetical protein IFM46972_04231 [Aspergillus udagawae]
MSCASAFIKQLGEVHPDAGMPSKDEIAAHDDHVADGLIWNIVLPCGVLTPRHGSQQDPALLVLKGRIWECQELVPPGVGGPANASIYA